MDSCEVHRFSIRLLCVATAALNGGGRAQLPSTSSGQQAPRIGTSVVICDDILPSNAGHHLRPVQCAMDAHPTGT